MIQIEETCQAGRIDILVASDTRKIGIEVKYKLSKDEFDKTVGQLVKYKQNCDSMILLSVQPNYSHYEGRELDKRLRDSGVEFIERYSGKTKSKKTRVSGR